MINMGKKPVPPNPSRVEWAIHRSAEWDKSHPDTRNTIRDINREIKRLERKKAKTK